MTSLARLDGYYHLDAAHSSIAFVARHAGIAKVRGTFERFQGWADLDNESPQESALLVSVQAGSLRSRDPGRDAHLLSPDFFDVAKWPAITFVGTGFHLRDATRVDVDGDLTVRDVTRRIRVHFDYLGDSVDPYGNHRIGFTGATTVARSEYGLVWNAALETGGVLVSDIVKLEFEVSAVKQADALAPTATGTRFVV